MAKYRLRVDKVDEYFCTKYIIIKNKLHNRKDTVEVESTCKNKMIHS